MENCSNSIKYDDDMFNNNIEEPNEDYIFDEDNLDEIRQFDSEDELDYDITELINAAINNTK
ncbi:13375_t:CDS:2 [Racocetra persica]|uniref:13375_t:CDS:1 n=1 Tax=Racocetra persica TaxID=160502 RepID=A0ACA9PU25_9GLOM|nr:13375_t:CDS:2 [Racocetra persica]